MSDKAFNKKLAHRCEYCIHGKRLDGAKEIICKKRGVTEPDDFCRKYKYNPLKRIPEDIKIVANYGPEDFSI